MHLTPNFTLEELTASDAAVRLGIDNTAPSDVLPNLVRLAQMLEQVRAMLGVPIIVTSGYRSPEVNKAVGGSSASAHCDGRAADFKAPDFGTPMEVCRRIARSQLAFDQLIFEGAWSHIAIQRFEEKPRMHLLTAHFDGGPATYTAGIT